MNKRIITAVGVLLTVTLTVIILLVKTGEKNADRSTAENVFDEMMEKEYDLLQDAEHITVGGDEAIQLTFPIETEPEIKIGLIYSSKYKKLYIYGHVSMPEDTKAVSSQEYFRECMEENGITWDDMEDYKEEFICRNILGTWFEEHESKFSKNRLGRLEVIDYLMPYEYCVMDNEDQKRNTVIYDEGYRGLFEGRVEYTTWKAPLGMLCLQESRDFGYRDIIERIDADINGFDTVSEKFMVIWEPSKEPAGSNDYLTMYIYEREEFVAWLKSSGKVKGNLTKLSYGREEGEAKTKEMLENCPAYMLHRIIKTCDFYFDSEHLYIRIPYYDYEAENPGWLENGENKVWQGWLMIERDDIQDYLYKCCREI